MVISKHFLKIKNKQKITLYLTIIFFSFLIYTQSINAQQLPFAHLSISDGLEDTVIFSIKQDNYGFLWVSTRTGINRFDGEQFWTYGRINGLPHNLSRDLLSSRDGTLWAASELGVAWFDGIKFQPISDWPEKISARSMSEAPDGTIWVATYGAGLFQIKTGENPKIINQINYESGLPNDRVRTIFIDSKGNIWAGMNNHVVRISNGQIEKINWDFKKTEIRTFYEHTDGSIWAGTRLGIARFDGESFSAFNMGIDLSQQTINTIIRDKENNVWLGTRDFGVYKFDTNLKSIHLDMVDGLPDNSVNSIYQDDEANLWFGTYGGGLARLSTSKVLNWKSQTNLTNPNIYSIADDHKGCIWFGTNGNGVSSLCNKQMKHYSRKDGLPHNKVLSTIIDNKGTPWFGTLQGLSHFENNQFVNYDQQQGMSGSVSYHILQTSDETFWVGTNNGLDHFDGEKFTQYNQSHGLPNNRINRLLESRDGGLWIASANGLTKFKNNEFKNYSTNDGLPANFINDFYEDNLGGLWIATNNGLSYFINGKFKNWTTANGLPHNNSSVILPGNGDEIWVGTSRGVAIFNGKDFTVITSREGLVFDLVNRGSGYKGTNGDLWFGTGNGISRFSADFKPGSSSPPPVHLLSVSNNQVKLAQNIHADVPQQGSSLNFKFSAISFQRAPDVNFKYRLANGSNSPWRETRLREIQINSLAAGDYNFEVTARIGTGKWNKNTAKFNFTVVPPFWRTLWFLVLVIVAILGVFVYRNYRSRLHAIHLENTVLERTKQLHELNKGLEWLANHDNLTRLPNRNHLHQKLNELQFSHSIEQLGVIVIDLDYFKIINDKYGHTAGDIALKVFAEMLQKIIRKNQIASRWGGEEFLIICPQIDSPRLKKLSEEIIMNCRQLDIIISHDQAIKLNCSIGFALTPLYEEESQNEIPWGKTIQLADLALYDAKHSGRNCAIGYIWKTAFTQGWSFKKAISQKQLAIKEGLLERIKT